MEIRSLEVDIDRGILKINGKEVKDPTIVKLSRLHSSVRLIKSTHRQR